MRGALEPALLSLRVLSWTRGESVLAILFPPLNVGVLLSMWPLLSLRVLSWTRGSVLTILFPPLNIGVSLSGWSPWIEWSPPWLVSGCPVWDSLL